MDVDVFANAHSGRWQRLRELSAQRRLTGREADELVGLYRQVATHLSLLRSNAPDPALGKFAREVFNEFFPVFRAAVNAEGLEVMSVVEESWNLRITLSNSKTQAQVAIYSDGRGRIKSSNWVGKPPGDHSLVDAFGRALKRI